MNINEKTSRVPKVVCIGGGTGLSTMLRGMKKANVDITAIVTVADDGGGSGVLRRQLGILPPGDIRNCILALSNIEPTMEKLLNYRFKKGYLRGQSFGNLFLAAMDGISESFDEAVTRMGEVLAITGRVLPVTTENVWLKAEFEDGTSVLGESKICKEKKLRDCRIKQVSLVPPSPKPLDKSIEAIENADMIILGPGSLYTSVIPNLLTSGISEAITSSDALKIYVGNIMTQNGETEGYTMSDHIRELFTHGRGKLFDICIANSDKIPQNLIDKYKPTDSEPIFVDEEKIREYGVKTVMASVASFENDLIRHDPSKLTGEIMKLYKEMAPTRRYTSE